MYTFTSLLLGNVWRPVDKSHPTDQSTVTFENVPMRTARVPPHLERRSTTRFYLRLQSNPTKRNLSGQICLVYSGTSEARKSVMTR